MVLSPAPSDTPSSIHPCCIYAGTPLGNALSVIIFASVASVLTTFAMCDDATKGLYLMILLVGLIFPTFGLYVLVSKLVTLQRRNYVISAALGKVKRVCNAVSEERGWVTFTFVWDDCTKGGDKLCCCHSLATSAQYYHRKMVKEKICYIQVMVDSEDLECSDEDEFDMNASLALVHSRSYESNSIGGSVSTMSTDRPWESLDELERMKPYLAGYEYDRLLKDLIVMQG